MTLVDNYKDVKGIWLSLEISHKILPTYLSQNHQTLPARPHTIAAVRKIRVYCIDCS